MIYKKELSFYPDYAKAIFKCGKFNEIETASGIIISPTRDGGLRLKLDLPAGNKMTAMVYSEEQYQTELLRLDRIALTYTPRIEKPKPKKKVDFTMTEQEIKQLER